MAAAPEASDRLLILGGPRAAPRAGIEARCPGLAVETALLSDPGVGDAVARANILLGYIVPADAGRRATRRQWVQGMGAGVDRLLVVRELDEAVAITRIGRGFAAAMAEHVLGYLLALALEVPRALDQQRRRVWESYDVPLLRERT